VSSPSHVTRVRSALRKMKEADGREAVERVCRDEGIYSGMGLQTIRFEGSHTTSTDSRIGLPREFGHNPNASAAKLAIRAAGGLVGGVEACEILGIPKDQRGNLGRLEGLPEPVGETARGRVWLRSEMEAFATKRKEARG
jgi:hypothetical protein